MISERTRQALVDLIVEEARERVIKNREITGRYNLLLQRVSIWKSQHYELLASLLDISSASIKRLFNLPGHKAPKAISNNIEFKILNFLHTDSWIELQGMIDNYLVSQQQNRANKEIMDVKNDLRGLGDIIKALEKRYENIYSKFEHISYNK
ncbi:MAG: hypothetical protein AAF149_25160 [Bacteroidota bacterium]